MSNTASNLPAAQAAPQNENLPGVSMTREQPRESTMEELAEAVASTKGKDLKTSEVASVNMVDEYLSFDEIIGEWIRRFFLGWTIRPLVDFNTKEPLCDPGTGEQLYGPAAILFDPETEKMQVNMASILVGTIKSRKFKPGTALQIKCTGTKKTSSGYRAQTFDIRTLENA